MKYNMNPIQYGGWEEQQISEYKIKNALDFSKYLQPKIKEYIKSKFENKTYNKNPINDAYNAIQYLRKNINDENIINEFKDDLNYDNPKYSILPEGTIFFRRQITENFDNTEYFRPIWLDYTGTIGSGVSFLKDTNDKYTQKYLDATISKFGNYLFKIKTTKPLIIFHHPSMIYSNSEFIVRNECIYLDTPYCAYADGYTLDFLQFNPNEIYKDKDSLDGFRELCILNCGNLIKVEEEQNAGKRKSRRNRKSKKGKKSRKARKSRRKSNRRRR